MVEFSFRVTVKYHDPQAFIDEDLEKVHLRIADSIKEVLEYGESSKFVAIEVEPT